jgi:hypothetical protein
MSLGKHLDEAVNRLEDAGCRIEDARAKNVSLDSLRDWLAALTDYAKALGDVQLLNNESAHEKLHALADHVGMKDRI